MAIQLKHILLGAIILLLLLLGGWAGYSIKQCPSCEPLSVRIDTIYPKDTMLKLVLKPKPMATKTISKNTPFKNDLKTFNTVISMSVDSCRDVVRFYSDTFYKPLGYRAVINDTIVGELVGRSFYFANLQPQINTTTVLAAKQPFLKLYVGAFGMGGRQAWGVGVKANAVLQDRFMLGYGFDIRNGTHQGEFLIKLNAK